MEEQLSDEKLEALKAKKDEEASMLMVGIRPTAKYCQTCAFADGGTPDSNAPEKGHCMAYMSPASKPNDVLFKDARCDYYLEIPK